MVCTGRPIPQLEDITGKTGISFEHTFSPEKKYIVESMSGGVILFDYDRDGWLDIYFPNAPSVAMMKRPTTDTRMAYPLRCGAVDAAVSARSGCVAGLASLRSGSYEASAALSSFSCMT